MCAAANSRTHCCFEERPLDIAPSKLGRISDGVHVFVGGGGGGGGGYKKKIYFFKGLSFNLKRKEKRKFLL